ncbi:MAG: hypothetical protein Q9220_007672 [cf. Caloplaca sp. 1 TL-2023]
MPVSPYGYKNGAEDSRRMHDALERRIKHVVVMVAEELSANSITALEKACPKAQLALSEPLLWTRGEEKFLRICKQIGPAVFESLSTPLEKKKWTSLAVWTPTPEAPNDRQIFGFLLISASMVALYYSNWQYWKRRKALAGRPTDGARLSKTLGRTHVERSMDRGAKNLVRSWREGRDKLARIRNDWRSAAIRKLVESQMRKFIACGRAGRHLNTPQIRTAVRVLQRARARRQRHD